MTFLAKKSFSAVVILFLCLHCGSLGSQNLTHSLTACYALDGSASEPINNLTGTLSAVTATVDRFNNSSSALFFSGSSSSYISLPNNSLLKPTNGVSFSAWVKFNSIAQSHYIVFAQNQCGSFHEGYTLIGYNTGSGFKLSGVKSGSGCSGSTQHVLTGNTSLSANTWYHVGLYAGNDSLKIYLNGSLEGTLASAVTLNFTNTPVYLGGSGVSFNVPLNGSLDNVRFYDRKLSGTEFNMLYTLDPTCTAPPPSCNGTLYEINGGSSTSNPTLQVASINAPATFTLSPGIIPVGALGLAIGPAFGFTAPNPTYWTTVSGSYWYYNGSTFVNTNHSTGNSNAINPGGSKSFIYNINGNTGDVYVYNGTGNSSLLMTVPSFTSGMMAFDVVGDDMDNFYLLRTMNPQSLNVYNSSGVLTCTYTSSGFASSVGGGGLAIYGNTVAVEYGGSLNYVGTISGTAVTFTPTSGTAAVPNDFATCPVVTAFTSTITAAPVASVSCFIPTIALIANSNVSPATYTWSGPGIVGSVNNQSVQVNTAGVYSVFIKSCPGGTSQATFNVQNASNATITASGSMGCTTPTINLTVLPGSPYTALWSGPGIVGANNTSVITINAGGIYTAVVTDTNISCSLTGTINIISSIAPLGITINPSSALRCLPAGGVTLTANGATNYTWSPGASVSPSTSAVVVASPGSTTTYSVAGVTGVCTGTGFVTVTVANTPTLINTGGNPIICFGTTTLVSVSGAGSYTWSPGGFTGSTMTVSPGVTTVYTAVGANGSCTSAITVTVTVNPLPVLSPSASPTVICQGSSATLTANNAVTYTWQPINVNGSTVVVTPSVNTAYVVGGTNGSGCTATAVVGVSVNLNPTVNISPASATLCAGKSVTLTGSGAGTYTWSSIGSTSAIVVVTPSLTTTYTLFGRQNNCTSSKTIQVTVLNNPFVFAIATPTAVCSGNSSILNAGGGMTYTWQPVNLTGATASVTPLVNTVYTVTGTDNFGCTGSTTLAVTVNTVPVLSILSSANPICAGSTATMIGSGAVNYTWQPGNFTQQLITVNPVITTIYTLTGMSQAGCTAAAVYVLTVTPLPIINALATPSIICSGSSSTLTALGASNFSWFPVGLTGATVIVSPTNPTLYQVTGSSSGCTGTANVIVLVNPVPVLSTSVSSGPAVSASSITTCQGNNVNLSAFGPGFNSYNWMPGNMPGANVIIYNIVSSMVYTVTATSANGCSRTATISVVVNQKPFVAATTSTLAVCSGGNATLIAVGATTYTWMPGSLTGSLQVVYPNVFTTYTVTGRSAAGCTNTSITQVSVIAGPNVIVSSVDSIICRGETTFLQASGAFNYTWSPAGLLSAPNSALVQVFPTLTTVYQLTGSNGLCISSTQYTVWVQPTPNLAVPLGTLTQCAGVTVTLSTSGAESYTWQPGNLNGASVTVTPFESTNYTVTGSNAFGCKATAVIHTSVIPGSVLNAGSSSVCAGISASLSVNGSNNYTWMPGNLNGNTVTVIPAATTIYTVLGSGSPCPAIGLYTLTVNNCNTSTNTVFGLTNAASTPMLTQARFYKIDFTVTAVNASTLQLTNVTLNSHLATTFPYPCTYSVVSAPRLSSQGSLLNANALFNGESEPSLTTPASSTLLPQKRDTLVFSILVEPKGFAGSVKNSVIGFADRGNLVIVSDSSNNGFAWDPDLDGDPTNNNVTTTIDIKAIDLFIPEEFSPNGDGTNDLFVIKGLDVKPVKLTIFNRWGSKVFSKEGNDVSWDGKCNASGAVLGNGLLPEGTYYYVLEFTDGGQANMTGFVVLQY